MNEAAHIWMDGALVPWAEARVHVLTHALHYGTAVLEGTRAYETAQGPAVFRLDDHLTRLHHSARIIGLPLRYTTDELRAATLKTVAANGHPACYIRHLAHRGYGEMGIAARSAPTVVSIATWEWAPLLEQGVRLMTSSWRRNDQAVVPTAAKATGPYLNSVLAKSEALDAGYDEAVLLNAAGYVSECTGANLFVVRDGRLATPPPSAGALDGITQDTVERLAADLGVPVARRDLLRSDLYTADEVFLCGTAAGIVHVDSVDNRALNGRGPVTAKLSDAYDDVVHGRDPRYRHWLTPLG
ncbi:branched-chain amino acid transaminase [Nonomuraea roseoviolacea]|uniref:Branched-chain-amino-acid aminotransferase n=1 Tax=Nonomuraea roseoviolacea subsp. carminata TaxID=160689 RepID=A0ABT1KBU2_9ACTN|nr:branched-chain amino acid transaminase [Nonomuraea roseoviolacea]MCP2351067.1 branched-chain amino acid aminotransferase [Nonomuraea roseoviolacea subsp. carminata]